MTTALPRCSAFALLLMKQQLCSVFALELPSKIYLSPKWQQFSGWSDAKALISGIFEVTYEWNETLLNALVTSGKPDIRDVVDLNEMVTGNPGRIKKVNFGYADQPVADSWVHARAIMVYAGDFIQQVDGTCYPFDKQTTHFTFTIPAGTWGAYFDMHLYCVNGDQDCEAYDFDGNLLEASDPIAFSMHGMYTGQPAAVAKIIQRKYENKRAKNFDWSALTCEREMNERQTSSKFVCKMTALRGSTRKLDIWLWPFVILIVIGFASMLIPVAFKMPRVACTMICLLALMTKTIALTNDLPTKGKSWLQNAYDIGNYSLMVNLVGHVVSFRYESVAGLIAELTINVGFFLMFLYLAVELHMRGCTEGLKPSDSGTVVAVAAVLLVLSLLSLTYSLWTQFGRLKALARTSLSKKNDESRPSGIFDADDEDANALRSATPTPRSKGEDPAKDVEKTLQIDSEPESSGPLPQLLLHHHSDSRSWGI